MACGVAQKGKERLGGIFVVTFFIICKTEIGKIARGEGVVLLQLLEIDNRLVVFPALKIFRRLGEQFLWRCLRSSGDNNDKEA